MKAHHVPRAQRAQRAQRAKRAGIGLTLLLFGCVSPHRVQTTTSPSLDTCKYKTYVFLTPEDQTLNQWLSDPANRQILEDMLRNSLKEEGLTEVPAGSGSADLAIRQRLESSMNAATKSPEGVTMASDYKLAKWKIELAERTDGPAIWSTQMDAVIGDIKGQNQKRAREGLHTAFVDYPPCRTRP